MHARGESSDSTLAIRRNPLNIRRFDGTDLVFNRPQEPIEESVEARDGDETSVYSTDSGVSVDSDPDRFEFERKHVKVSHATRVYQHHREHSAQVCTLVEETDEYGNTRQVSGDLGALIQKEKMQATPPAPAPAMFKAPETVPVHADNKAGADTTDAADKIAQLSISEGGDGVGAKNRAPSAGAFRLDLGLNDSPSLAESFENTLVASLLRTNSAHGGPSQLSRKNTIGSRGDARTGPSTSPLVIEKMREAKRLLHASPPNEENRASPANGLAANSEVSRSPVNEAVLADRGPVDPPADAKTGQTPQNQSPRRDGSGGSDRTYRSVASSFGSGHAVKIPTPLLNAIAFPSPPMTAESPASGVASGRTSTLASGAASLAGRSDSTASGASATASNRSTARAGPSRDLTPDGASIYQDAQGPAPETPSISSVSTMQSPTIAELDPIDPEDRGRLFVQIGGIKDLRLPLDYGRNPKFSLTLDNGIQSVTTVPVPFGKNLRTDFFSIGQEFELLVGDDLELVLTLNLEADPLPELAPPPQPSKRRSRSPVKGKKDKNPEPVQDAVTPPQSPTKKRFSWFGRSPKKSEQSQQQRQRSQSPVKSAAKPGLITQGTQQAERKRDVWKHLVGKRGEFARAYIIESQFEKEIYGRPQTYFLQCFNEWSYRREAINPEAPASLIEYRHVKREAYPIGGLQVTLMFVPRLFRAETLPSSMRGALEELQVAQSYRHIAMDGNLTQYGGDCRVWRRRWFTLNGNEFVGHHEESRKVRTRLDMHEAVAVVEPSQYEIEDSVPVINDDRAFRVLFKDGTVIAFYADTVPDKDRWVQGLSMALAHCSGKVRHWTDLVHQHYAA